MTINAMKRIIRDKLASFGMDNKLTAKTVSFVDLARANMVFVKVHGWKPNPVANDLEGLARTNGFRIEFVS